MSCLRKVLVRIVLDSRVNNGKINADWLSGVAWDMNKTFNHQQQISTQTVEQWAKENLKT